MAAAQCQLVLGFPLDAQDAAAPEGLRATRPYGRTGFVLVTRKAAPADLEQLPQGSAVAVTYMTAPNLYFADHPRLSPQVFTSDAASLRALGRGEVSAAMLWRPYVAAHAGRLHMTALREPHAAWNLVALYAEANAPVARGFELAVDELRQSGRLQRLLRPYADVAEPVAAAAPARFEPAVARGRLIRVAGRKGAAAKAPPALYTAQQADTGEQLFQQNCAVCHGPKLEGRAGPALKGPGFASPQAHFSVSDVFKIVSQNMPAPAPGTLPQEDYVNIMAFLLRENGYPAAEQPLSFDAAGKSRVRLIYREAAPK
jgi:mono/diheme cytochrome c family protein